MVALCSLPEICSSEAHTRCPLPATTNVRQISPIPFREPNTIFRLIGRQAERLERNILHRAREWEKIRLYLQEYKTLVSRVSLDLC